MSPDLLQQCLGETPENLELLVLTSEQDSRFEWLQRGGSLRTQATEIHSIAEGVDVSVLERRRWPLVCVLQLCEVGITDKPAFIRLLGRLRDLHADRIIHVETSCKKQRSGDPANDYRRWTLADSLALGYSRRGMVVSDNRQLHIFEFDIRTYKPAPDWLNAKHWANPERWGKQRW